jgi:hypothetical protein
MSTEQANGDVATDDTGDPIFLEPVRNFRRRAIIWAALCAFALIGTAGFFPKLAFCLSMGLLLGSFPQAKLENGAFHSELYVLFWRARKKRWKLERFVQIEVGLEDRPFDSFANVFKSGELMNKIWGLFDACVPWLGGDYKIWLRSASGKRVLAWQGSNDEQFQGNLDILRRATGLHLERVYVEKSLVRGNTSRARWQVTVFYSPGGARRST